MTATVFTCRLFGGKDVGITYDSSAGTIAILGQSITISSLPAALQSQWTAALGGGGMSIPTGTRPAFGGDNIGVAIGNILDAQPTWRAAVQTALAAYASEQTSGGLVAGVETFNRQ
jgi:hypothetical protein